MSFSRNLSRTGRLYKLRDKLEQRLAAQDAADSQPGPSKTVFQAPKPQSVLSTCNADPLGDPDESFDEDIKIAMEAIEMEEFKEEECELGEYVVLESTGNTDPLHPPKKARLNDEAVPSTFSTMKQPIVLVRNIMPSTQTISSIANTVVVRNPPIGTNAAKPQVNAQTATPSGSLPKPSQQVRVVPTERLRMAPSISNSAIKTKDNTTTVQVKPIGMQSDKPIIVKYAPVGSTTGNTVIQVKQPANNMQPPPVKKLEPNQTPIRVVPLTMLNETQCKIIQTPGPNVAVTKIGTMPQADPLTRVIPVDQPTNVGALSHQKPNLVTYSRTPMTMKPKPMDSFEEARSAPTPDPLATELARSAPTPDPLATDMARSAPTPDPLAMKPSVVQINNSMLSDANRAAPTPDPLAMGPTYTSLGRLDMVNNPSMIPVMNSLETISAKPAIVLQTSTTGAMAPWLPVVPSVPLATVVEHASVAKLLNTSTITVTRIVPGQQQNEASNKTNVVRTQNTQPKMEGDPLATYSEAPSTARSNIATPTMTKSVPAKPQTTAKAGISASSTVPGVVLLKNANLTVTKIGTPGTSQQNGTPGTSTKPVPPKVNQPTVRVVRQAPPAPSTTKVPSTTNGPRKNCDCRVEIAKRLRLLDQRTRQMESYMNDLIDLIQPQNEFYLEPIKSLDELERLNYDLGSSPQLLQKVKSWLDKRINGNDSHWRMLDAVNLIFETDFLMQCSWKYAAKIPLNSYTYIIELFKHAGSTPYNKVTIICVGNFLMGHIKSLLKKKVNVEKKKNERTAVGKVASSSKEGTSNKKEDRRTTNQEDATNQKDATNQVDATNQAESTNQEDAANQNDATNQGDANDQSEASNQDDATNSEDQAERSNASQSYIEQEIDDNEMIEYLDEDDVDFNLESTDFLNDDTLSSEA